MTQPAAKLAALGERMRAWTLRRRVAVSFAAMALVLLLLATLIAVSLTQFVVNGNDVVYRWGPASLRSQDVLTDLINEETGVRGYALSGRVESLQPFEQYSAQEPKDAANLRSYLAGHPPLIAALEEFEQAADAWRARTALPVIAALGAGTDPRAITAAGSLSDKARFDVIRLRAADLINAVQAQLRHARALRSTALVFVVVALSVSAVTLCVAALVIWRGLHRWVLGPVDRLSAQARAVADGQPGARIVPRGPPEFISMAADVESMRRQAATALAVAEAGSAELKRSNADLEQFAYVASHDLSEPLRKIANFNQLLERQYGPQLDDTARQYIGFAVDGAKRMQKLIADLLALSRVGRNTDAFSAVDMTAALQDALANLEDAIAEAGAGIGHSDLPTLQGDFSLLVALFDNLIGNAIKYRGQDPPLVVVTAVADPGGFWTFTVSDNGIGIDPQYAERVFAIFQRLHHREVYSGTGIGLALCRKIVELHGGRIWLDTHADPPGATFRFTLPERRPVAH
ncbi:MAG: ATP-binding protein [Actinomycetota bacterium]|nr:ATP-binding protein [Actinomycetota bacterium]